MKSNREKQAKRRLREFALNNLNHVILPYWLANASDKLYGGVIGEINHLNQPLHEAPKGLILNSRVLWTFSACYNFLKDEKLLEFAHVIFQYIGDKFYDPVHKGFYWLVDFKGKPLDMKKQTYAQAFALYGLSEYYSVTGHPEALQMAKDLFWLIESKCFDRPNGGYHEAFSRDWNLLEDMRLSEKDIIADKSVNTHLHIIEAYTCLFKIWKEPKLKDAIIGLLSDFDKYFINPKDYHLNLFFDTQWAPLSSKISFGHDIEAGWLLQEGAEIINKSTLVQKFKKLALKLSDSAMKGISDQGYMIYESDRDESEAKDNDSEWWVQAEAVVGLINAYQVSAQLAYLEAALKLSEYISEFVVNVESGEWHNRVSAQGVPIAGLPLAGFWKCPYHNSRMCLEILRRIGC